MTLEQKARELTDYFFTSGADEKATHLRLAIEDGENHWKHLGAWGRLPFQEAIKASLAAVAADAWVPVEERLPEESGYYDVTNSRGHVETWFFNADNIQSSWSMVRAWRALPAPYQPQEEK